MKKTLGLITLSLLLTSCGKEYVTSVEYKAQDFEGYYYCENNSTIELVTDYSNRVTIESTGQSLNSVNPQNNTLGTHPTISYRDLIINKDRLVIPQRNYNYSSSTYDLENDTTGSDITGSKRTDVNMKMLSSDHLEVNIKIYANAINSNINSIVLDRTFSCKK